MRMTTLDTVRQVVAEELGIPDDEVGIDQSFVDMGADSMDMRSLILAFEEELSIEIPNDDAQSLRTPQDVINYASRR